MYQLHFTTRFLREEKRIRKKDISMQAKLKGTVRKLAVDPFSAGLKSHKVNSLQYGEVYSSRVTGDIRILWDFDRDGNVIILLTVGGHSGGSRVYKREV